MAGKFEETDDGQGVLGLSHRLVALHAGGVALLIFVVLGTALWISAEHNRLALRSSESLVQSGIAALRTQAHTLVRDYSIWDEGYAGVMADDRAWIYSNIGASVAEIGTFDLALLHAPGPGPAFGWMRDSPPEGETNLLPDAVLAPVLALLDETGGGTLIAEFEDAPWIFAVSRITPMAGIPENTLPESLPWQIHGQEITSKQLKQIGKDNIEGALSLAQTAAPGQASIPLIDFTGRAIARVVWSPPRPGASILRKAAIPLALALSVATAISAISSLYAVRSARRLERALYASKAADRSKSEFLSNVSHELRTPMNGVLGAAQLLDTTELDPEQRELIGVLMSSAKAQMSLISDLIDFGRVDAGRRTLVSEPFEPSAVMKEVVDMMRVAGARKQIPIEGDWSAIEGVKLRGDARAFRQVVTNLLSNAIKFTEKGSVLIRATLDDTAARARITVRVADTGPGIPESALPRIFERFYQVDGSLTRATEGTGLGLAISLKLAQMMDGDITVSSQLGTGSTFEFVALFDRLAWPSESRDAA